MTKKWRFSESIIGIVDDSGITIITIPVERLRSKSDRDFWNGICESHNLLVDLANYPGIVEELSAELWARLKKSLEIIDK